MTSIILCSFRQAEYKYKGFHFEVDRFGEPWMLNSKGDPTNKRPPGGFWLAWDLFNQLTDEQKKQYQIKE